MNLQRQTLPSLLLLFALAVGNADAQTKVNDCTRITESGSYILSKNILAGIGDLKPTATGGFGCIVIAADSVTLDLAGHTITGPGTVGDGIVVDHNIVGGSFVPRTGISVHSGVVTKFGNTGVFLEGTDGSTVAHVRVIANGNRGMRVTAFGGGLNGHRIVGNTALSNTIGIEVHCPAVVLENVATGNSFAQILTAGAGCTTLVNSPVP